MSPHDLCPATSRIDDIDEIGTVIMIDDTGRAVAAVVVPRWLHMMFDAIDDFDSRFGRRREWPMSGDRKDVDAARFEYARDLCEGLPESVDMFQDIAGHHEIERVRWKSERGQV